MSFPVRDEPFSDRRRSTDRRVPKNFKVFPDEGCRRKVNFRRTSTYEVGAHWWLRTGYVDSLPSCR